MFTELLYSTLGRFIKNRRTLASVYKAVCILLSALLCGGISAFTLSGSRRIYGLALAALAVFVALVCVVLSKKTANLHTFPSALRSVDTKGGLMEIIDATGENVLDINFGNGCYIKLNFRGGTYTAVLKNDEWDIMDSASTEDDGDELIKILKQFIEKASKYVPAEPYEYEEADSEADDEAGKENDTEAISSDGTNEDDDEKRLFTKPGGDGAVL